MAEGRTEVHVDVRVASGSRAGDLAATYVVPHQWSDGGVAIEGGGTGAHLLLTAVGACVLNDLYREADPGVAIDGVLVEVGGDFDAETWSATTIGYTMVVDSDEADDVIARLVDAVDSVAEIPRALRGDVVVERR